MNKVVLFFLSALCVSHLAMASSEGTANLNDQGSYVVVSLNGDVAKEMYELSKKEGQSSRVCNMDVVTGKVFTCYKQGTTYGCGSYLNKDTTMTPTLLGCTEN